MAKKTQKPSSEALPIQAISRIMEFMSDQELLSFINTFHASIFIATHHLLSRFILQSQVTYCYIPDMKLSCEIRKGGTELAVKQVSRNGLVSPSIILNNEEEFVHTSEYSRFVHLTADSRFCYVTDANGVMQVVDMVDFPNCFVSIPFAYMETMVGGEKFTSSACKNYLLIVKSCIRIKPIQGSWYGDAYARTKRVYIRADALRRVLSVKDIKRVIAENNAIYFLTEDGKLYVCGEGNEYQSCEMIVQSIKAAILVPGLPPIRDIHITDNEIWATSFNGELYHWHRTSSFDQVDSMPKIVYTRGKKILTFLIGANSQLMVMSFDGDVALIGELFENSVIISDFSPFHKRNFLRHGRGRSYSEETLGALSLALFGRTLHLAMSRSIFVCIDQLSALLNNMTQSYNDNWLLARNKAINAADFQLKKITESLNLHAKEQVNDVDYVRQAFNLIIGIYISLFSVEFLYKTVTSLDKKEDTDVQHFSIVFNTLCAAYELIAKDSFAARRNIQSTLANLNNTLIQFSQKQNLTKGNRRHANFFKILDCVATQVSKISIPVCQL